MAKDIFLIVERYLLAYTEYKMAIMNMTKAFNARMLSKMVRIKVFEGTYDENNNWVDGKKVEYPINGIIRSGNKFSQFEEGLARHPEEGGIRLSNFRTLYVIDKYELEISDLIVFKGETFTVIQKTNEMSYNFTSYLLEERNNDP